MLRDSWAGWWVLKFAVWVGRFVVESCALQGVGWYHNWSCDLCLREICWPRALSRAGVEKAEDIGLKALLTLLLSACFTPSVFDRYILISSMPLTCHQQ